MHLFTKCSYSALILGAFCIAGLGTLLGNSKTSSEWTFIWCCAQELNDRYETYC